MYHIGWDKVRKSKDNEKEWEKAVKTAKATVTQGKSVVRQINRCFSLQIKTDILMLNAA